MWPHPSSTTSDTPSSHCRQMPPKTKLYPLLLALLAALFLYYSYHFTLPPPDLHLHPLPFPLPPSNSTFTFTVKVLAYDRLASISRCLRSLAAADYAGDRVDLHLYVDHFVEPDPGGGPEVLEAKIAQAREILDFVDGFGWRFGEKMVHYRTRNAGLQAQWLEAWWPRSDDDFVFVVEDDLQVSPLYYRFLKGLILKYYYDPSNYSPSIYGASLQRPRFVAGKHGNKLHLDGENRLFLYQMVGTWGQLLFPKPWKEFRIWYDIHKAKRIKPLLQGMVTTGWYKKMGERIWTPWFIKFIHSRGYFNIYTNFMRERALSVSHRDPGVNYGKTAGPDSQLIEENTRDFDLWKLLPLVDMKWYDFCFREVIPNRLVKQIAELRSVIYSVQRQQTIIYISIYRISIKEVMNLLCHFDRLNIKNSILVGVNSEFLSVLARRGYAVIDAEKLFADIVSHKLVQGMNSNLNSEIFVKAFLMKNSLDLGLNAWIADGNFVPVEDPFVGLSSTFKIANFMEFVFVKNSDATKGILNDNFIYKASHSAEQLMGKTFTSEDNKNFGTFLSMYLLGKGLTVDGVNETNFGLNVVKYNVNQSSLAGGKKLVFWSPERDLDLLQRKLHDTGLWVLDDDMYCNAVICHPS